ncbi:IS4 family transposase, partial [Caldibacillus thermoamylovorans]
RKEEDPKTIGNLFYILCEDVKDIDFITALQSLIDLFQTLAEAEVSLNMDIFKNQMNKWLVTISNYIKQCLNITVCES